MSPTQKRPARNRAASEDSPLGHIYNLLLVTIVSAFVAGGLYFGLLFLSKVGDIVTSLSQKYVELPISIGTKRENAPDWKSKERVNILLLGIDQRPDEVNVPTRTDTMLLITLDPLTKTGGLLSIPRDLWVPIPLDERRVINDRINTANVYGELYKYPGGGPGLAKATVQYNLGIKVHYYALIDFEGFKKIIDTLGGITVKLDKPLDDWEYPTPDYGTTHIYIPAGVQNLDGEKALWYARSRNTPGSDIDRMKRQQDVLLALRDKALRLDILPKLPELARRFKDVIKTDLSIPEALTLSKIGNEIETENIIGRSLDNAYVTPCHIDQCEAEVLLPKREKMAELVREMFFDARVQQEKANIEVLNGTQTPGLAARTASFLESQGFKRVSYGSSGDQQTHNQTIIYDYSGKPYTARLIADLLKIPPKSIASEKKALDSVDIRIILGTDLRLPEK